MADGLQIRATRDYADYIDITLRIPKEAIALVEQKLKKGKVHRPKKVTQKAKEFTEKDALNIARKAIKDYTSGTLESYEKFILREYPQYAKYLHQDY